MGSVTISATYGAHGDRVGHAVAERLDLPFLDRAIPNEVARKLHLSEESAETLDERVPSRWDRLVSAFSEVPPFVDDSLISNPIESSETFRSATESMLREVADSTGAVILGRAGMTVLKDRVDVLRVRLDGPLEARIARVVADGVDEKAARQTQRDVDGARQQYASFFYKIRQDDARLYHLVIDSTALPVDALVEIIVTAATARFESAGA